jgi:hypothetical protein
MMNIVEYNIQQFNVKYIRSELFVYFIEVHFNIII